MTTTSDMTALAEACERAAEAFTDGTGHCSDYARVLWCDECQQEDERANLLAAHARALRAGRVTISEEESPDA